MISNSLLLTINNPMTDTTTPIPEMTQMTEEQKAQADDQMHQAKLKAIKALK